MTEVQPSWMGPLAQADARLGQAVRFSVANFKAPGLHAIDYGNGHGVSLIVSRRFQVDFDPQDFFRNHSPIYRDGFGNAGAQIKWRILSGNAQHGNYIVTAMLWHGFSPGAYQNGAFSSLWKPTLAVGKGFSRFAVISNIGVVLPTANIYEQGRTIAWDTTLQSHPTPHIYVDLEENVATFRAGPFDGLTQNLVTPAVFYLVRRRNWSPTHTMAVFDCGLQTATTRFYEYNHNLVTEMRLFF